MLANARRLHCVNLRHASAQACFILTYLHVGLARNFLLRLIDGIPIVSVDSVKKLPTPRPQCVLLIVDLGKS